MTRVVAVLVLALAAVSVGAQNQPSFRTGVNYVRVDMYATRDGKPIEDLKVDEIDILEDGVLQKIDAFEYVKVRTAIPQDARIEPRGVAESREMAANPRARVFVIFLDTYHTQIEGSATMRKPLINFIDRVLGPDDLVAVMTPEMAASEIALGRKTTVITNLLEREWFWGRRARISTDNDEKEDLYEACYSEFQGSTKGIAKEMKERRRQKLTLDALEDLIVHLAGIREERKAVVAVSEGWLRFSSNSQLARTIDPQTGRGAGPGPGDILLRPPRPNPTDTGKLQGSPMVECEADRMALAMLNHEQRLTEITQDANRSNVTFYPVYARGLVAFDAPIGPDYPPPMEVDRARLAERHDTLRFIADATDGVSVINTNNIDGALRRIVDDLSSYYLMGYSATNTKPDGRFRSISVRVKRPGVNVRARKGYRAISSAELSRGGAGTSPSAAASAVTAAIAPVVSFSARAQFRIRTAAWSRPAANGGTGAFWIVGELDQQTKRLPAWSGTAQADVAIIAADGTPVSSRRLDIRPSDNAFSVEFPESEAAAGDYTVRIRLRSPVDGELGLSDTSRVTVKNDMPLGDAVLWRRGPSTGPQHMRTADPRFRRNERIRLELATSSTEPVTARLIDRIGQPMSVPVEVSERPDASGAFRWVVVDLALAPFGPADYAIEVTQGQAKQLTAFRVIP